MSNNIGAPKDSAATDVTGAWSVISLLKAMVKTALNGVTLAFDSSVVSKRFPLPTAFDAKSSLIQAIIEGMNFYYTVTAPGVFARYTAVQLWNPADSGVVIIVAQINGYNSAGSMTWTRIKSTTQLATLGGYSQNNNFGSATTSKLKLYYDALTSLTVANDFGKPSITTTGGTGSAATNGSYVLYPGQGMQLEGNTLNVGMTLIGNVTEIPLANF